MPKQKQEVALSFKVSHAMKAAIERQMEKHHRSQADMAKWLLAKSLSELEAEDNMRKFL